MKTNLKLENKRKWTTAKIAAKTNVPYEEVLKILRILGVHSNWTDWELENRPEDINELTEIVEEYIEEQKGELI